MEMTRRRMCARARAAAVMNFPHTALGGWEPSERYPDPADQDPRSELQEVPPRSRQRRAARDRHALVRRARSSSATPAACSGATSRTTASCAGTRRPARSASTANPPTTPTATRRDRQGRLVTCEHGTRRITRTEYDGTITVLMDQFEGKRLNSPNDIVREIRRLDLVHRSAVRHPRLLRRPRRDDRNCRPTSTASIPRPGRRPWWPARSTGRTALAFSPDETKLLHRRGRRLSPRVNLRLRRGRRRHASSPTSAC